ncbi:MAG: hypothetical protein LUD50_04085 [Clostridia bacterium]|nr:hypothetical protein [Clostridia bacterium]
MARIKLNRIILAASACLLLASACAIDACSAEGNYIERFKRAIDNTIAYSKSYAIYATEELYYANASYIRADSTSMTASYSHKSGEIAYQYDETDAYTDPTEEHSPITFSQVSEYYKLRDGKSYTAYCYDGADKVCTTQDEAYLTRLDKAQELSSMCTLTDTSNLYLTNDLLYYMLVHNGGPGIGHSLYEYTLEVSKDSGTTTYTVSYSGVDEDTGEADDVSVSYFISRRRIAGYTVAEDSVWTEDGVQCTLSYSLSYEFSYKYDAGIAEGADLTEYESID